MKNVYSYDIGGDAGFFRVTIYCGGKAASFHTFDSAEQVAAFLRRMF